MRAADARRSASIISNSSSSASLTPLPPGLLQSDCTTKTSEPRTFSPISMRVSSFLNFETRALPTCSLSRLAISSASAGFELPLKTRGWSWLNGRISTGEGVEKVVFETRSPSPSIKKSMDHRFRLVAPYALAGDQPAATAAIAEGVLRGDRAQTLLGVTGSGKTLAMARVIELVQKPTLVLAHNKTLAAQLCAEFREFFPHNAVEYFVSYFDYYQPEAYIAHTDTYIEKDSSINDEIERLRHSATQSILTRKDVLVVASVSCIYGLGSPADYIELSQRVRVGMTIDRDVLLRRLVDMQYRRNDINLLRGTFRVRGDTLEFVGVDEELVHRIEFFGDEIEAINVVNMLTGEYVESKNEMMIFPAKHFITPEEKLRRAITAIEIELDERLKLFKESGKLLEAQRLEIDR